MKEKFYGVELTDIGSNYNGVFSYMKKMYPGVDEKEIREVLDECKAGGTAPVNDCISEARANEICEEVKELGASATVYEMSDAEIQSAIKTGDIVLSDDSSSNNSNSSENVSPNEEYKANRRVLWRFMIFCMIGWAIAAIGFGVMNFNDIAGIVMVVVGVIIVDLPCYKLLLGGLTLGSLFVASAPVYEITYKSGRKTRDHSAKQGAMVIAIFTYIATLIIGVFVMVFRIFKCIITAAKIKKKNNLKISFKESIWVPTFIGLGEFAVFCAVMGIIGAVAEYKALHPEDMTKEEIVALLDASEADLVNRDFSYYISEWEDDTLYYHTLVTHAGVDNSYLVVLSGPAEELYDIDNGNYLYYQNEWKLIPNLEDTSVRLETTFSEKLDQFKIENLVDYAGMKEDINNVYGNDTNTVYTSLYWHSRKGLRGFDFDKSGNLQNVKDIPFLEDRSTTIHYDMNFGGELN